MEEDEGEEGDEFLEEEEEWFEEAEGEEGDECVEEEEKGLERAGLNEFDWERVE